jgi:hypothetical protein
MSKQIKALNMAIEALEDFSTQYARLEPIINACKEALEQTAQEPYAWATEWEDGEWSISHSPNMGKQSIPLYTHPYQWQGLTADELEDIKDNSKEGWYQLVRNVEQALKEKNT